MAGASRGLPRAACAWLRAAAPLAETGPWVLRGSVVLWASCPGARVPGDLDYLLPGTKRELVPSELERVARLVAARGALVLERVESIWGETETPGLRLHLRDASDTLSIDLAVGDPMVVPPRLVQVPEVGAVNACALETLFGWKLHGLCEYGPGRWRAKDLFDLDLLARCGALEPKATRAAIELAFSSRGLPLTALADFRERPSWGLSRGGRRKWAAFSAAQPADPFEQIRERVRAQVALLLDGP